MSGRHVKSVLLALIVVRVAFVGAVSNEKVKVWPGNPESFTAFVTKTVTPGFTVWGATGVNTGAVLLFTSPAKVMMLFAGRL